MERSREYLIDAINRRDPNVLRDIVDTLDARLSVSSAKKKVVEAPKSVQQVIQNFPVTWSTLTGKPTTFPPDAHTHDQYLTTETDPVFSVSPAAGITADEAALLRDELDSMSGWGGVWGHTWH